MKRRKLFEMKSDISGVGKKTVSLKEDGKYKYIGRLEADFFKVYSR